MADLPPTISLKVSGQTPIVVRTVRPVSASGRVRRTDTEAGFTLIELMVVVVILAVLLGIAVPTLLASRERAADAKAKAQTDLALKASRTIYADGNGYAGPAEIEKVEPSVQAVDDAIVMGAVYVKLEDGNSVVTLASRSGSGTCFWVKDNASIGITRFAEDDCDTAIEDLVWKTEW